jgi:hypothetical protein
VVIVRHLTWEEFDAAVDRLAVAVARRVPHVQHLRLQPRGGLALGVKGVELARTGITSGADVWVDDVVDSGATLRAAVATGTGVFVAWFSKLAVTPPGVVLLHDEHVAADVWLRFPWECADLADVERRVYLAGRAARATDG